VVSLSMRFVRRGEEAVLVEFEGLGEGGNSFRGSVRTVWAKFGPLRAVVGGVRGWVSSGRRGKGAGMIGRKNLVGFVS
jgi:hypothetical protein